MIQCGLGFNSMKSIKKVKIGIITSKGGHLFEILRLKNLFNAYNHFYVTFQGGDSKYYLNKENVYYAYFPESRNIINFIRNLFLAIFILTRERPNLLISCGAGIAVPFFIVGKLLYRAKLIYLEPYDFVSYPSLTGRILYNIADLFLIQQKCQNKWFPKAKYWGSLL